MPTHEDIQKEIDKIDEQIKSEEAKAWVDTDAVEKLKREKEIKQLEKRIAEIDEDIAKTNQSIVKYASNLDMVLGLQKTLYRRTKQKGELEKGKGTQKEKEGNRIKELEKKVEKLTADDPNKNKQEIKKADDEIEQLKREMKDLG